MRVNADFSRRAAITPRGELWQPSPESGVERLLLDRVGEEVARATSLVRYAPGSSFARHEHAMGEEFLVLAGVFSDGSGDYPAGSYVRNPPGSSHAPFSEQGCRIFVKLRQFSDDDRAQFCVDTRAASVWNGAEQLSLHAFRDERIGMRRVPRGEALAVEAADVGTEILIVDGQLSLGDVSFGREAWLRFPAGDAVRLTATEPTTVWMKTGHLTESALARHQ